MTEYKRSKRDAKKAGREARKGDVLYVIVEVAQNIAPYEDSHLVEEHRVTHDHPLLGGAMISGALSVEALVLTRGPVYTTRPKGLRAVHEPTPQVAGPLSGKEFNRPLTDAEIRDLERRYGKKAAKKIAAEALAGAR